MKSRLFLLAACVTLLSLSLACLYPEPFHERGHERMHEFEPERSR